MKKPLVPLDGKGILCYSENTSKGFIFLCFFKKSHPLVEGGFNRRASGSRGFARATGASVHISTGGAENMRVKITLAVWAL